VSKAEVVVAQLDQILIITINRPHARNAVNAAVSQGLAVAATKRIIVESRRCTLETMFAERSKIKPSVFESDDAREGAAAFAERRARRWSGTQ
jgi:enoyl-CoA hydratase